MSKYLDMTGLTYLVSKLKTLINTKANASHTHAYLSGLSVSGKTITYTKGDGTSGTITTQDTNTTYNPATTSANGLMSSTDKAKLDAITESADAVSVTQKLTSGTEIGTVTINGTGTKLYAPTNTDTHYASKNVVGSTTATSNTTTALTNGSVYLNSVENGAVTSTHKISGSGATTVTTDTSGNIVISSTDTNTNTTYSAGTGISLSGTTFSNSGVRSIASGSTNGTISVNTNGTSKDIAVKGLGSAAYTASTAYATSGHTHDYLPLSGGTINGTLSLSTCNSFRSRHVDGSTDGYSGELYLNYNSPDANIYLGNLGYCIGYNGSYYTGTSANADMVDGYHADNFVKLNYAATTNWDTLTDGGMYRMDDISNQPSIIWGMSSYGQLLVIRGTGDTIAQIYCNYSDNQIFTRSANGVGGSSVNWTSWSRLYTSSNITYGTSALTPGSSGLATGNIYLQYE